MWSKLLKWDRQRGLQVWMDVDEDNNVIFRHVDLHWRDVLAANAEYRKQNPKNVHAGNTQKHWVKVAEIPLHVYLQLREDGILKDKKAFKRWLNDPDNRAMRTYDGRV